MMIKVFSVYDSKAKVFSQPFYALNEDVAVRMFQASVNDRSTQFWKYPEDFTLFAVGGFDDNKGELVPLSPVENLGLASQYRERQLFNDVPEFLKKGDGNASQS